MKIIILAAGKGERLMPLTKNTPKPLLDMGNGNTLLEEQIVSIQESGILDEIVLVIGYLAEQVEAKIKMYLHNGIKIKTIFNPFYEVSNNLMSLWLARHELDTDFMITNGDNLFKGHIFNDMVQNCTEGIFLAVSKKIQYDDDDMKVIFSNGIIAKVSKEIYNTEISAESPGLSLISGSRSRKIFLNYLEKIVRKKKFINKFWLELFNLMHVKGVPVYPWVFDGKNEWQEVDFHIDLNKIKELVRLKWDKQESDLRYIGQ